MSLQRELRALGADITLSLERLDAPISLADAAGFVRWQNDAAIELVGDKRGTRFTAMAPDYVQQTRAALARRSMGADAISYETTVVMGADGERKRIKLIVLSLVSGTEFVGVLNMETPVDLYLDPNPRTLIGLDQAELAFQRINLLSYLLVSGVQRAPLQEAHYNRD